MERQIHVPTDGANGQSWASERDHSWEQPKWGGILLQNEETNGMVPAMPVATVVTQVLVDDKDPACKHLAEGSLRGGSMGSKVLAAIRFLDNGGESYIIASLERT